MKRISKGLSWDRISWQVPGQALGGGRLNSGGTPPAKEMGIAARVGGAGGPRRQTPRGVPGKVGEATLYSGCQRGGQASW